MKYITIIVSGDGFQDIKIERTVSPFELIILKEVFEEINKSSYNIAQPTIRIVEN